MQRLQRFSTPLKILTYAAAVTVVLAVAAGVGMMAALTQGSDGDSPPGAVSQRVEEAHPVQGGRLEYAPEKGVSDGSGGVAYLDEVAGIQEGSVEASLRSNDKLLRYDELTADDVEEMKADYLAIGGNARRAKDLAPSAEYEEQHKVFVSAIGELRDAAKLAYRLVADPSSATQTNFESYDRHVDRATADLRTSNEMLGKDYKTTAGAREISF
jgi:hypothetical protein